MENMNFAILGCGHIATKMAEAVKALEKNGYGVTAYACASRDRKKAIEFASKFGFRKAYGSYEELASDPKADLIYIATPHSHHFEFAKLCIEAGKNVLIEKAFTANAKQATQLISLAEDKGVFLQEAMWTRFLPCLSTIHKWINSGRIGNVECVEADFSMQLSHIERLRKSELAGGALLDIGIYPLTIADIFLGKDKDGKENRIVSVNSKCIKFETGVDSSEWINLTYENGTRAFLKSSMVSETHNEATIHGSCGRIWIKNTNDMEEIRLFDKSGNLVESIKPSRICNCYEYEVLACKKAIEEGKSECSEMPHAKTMEMMSRMDCLRESFGVSYPFEISPSDTWNRQHDKSILQIYDIETRKSTILKEFDHVIEAPNWSQDNKFITYNMGGRIYRLELIQNNDGSVSAGNTTEVQSHYVNNCNNDHVLAPDGSGLYVSHHTKEDGLSRIYKIFFDGRLPELVTPLAPSYLHGISPDGAHLAYCAERNGEYDIYTIPTNGGTETRLTTAKGLNDGPEYSCSGKYIWFNSVRSGRMQAFRMKTDGTEQEQMTFDKNWNTWFPHISPDEKKVVMICYHESDVRPDEHVPNKNVEIRLMEQVQDSVKFSEPTTILKLYGGQGTINVNSWAHDSRRFAFVSYVKG